MIKQVADGYILESGTKVMFLTKEQEKQFNEEQKIIRLNKEYSKYIERKKNGNLFGINVLISIDGWGKSTYELMKETFTSYDSALEFLKNNNMLNIDCYEIVPLEYKLQLCIKT